jgi:hypothetical protein
MAKVLPFFGGWPCKTISNHRRNGQTIVYFINWVAAPKTDNPVNENGPIIDRLLSHPNSRVFHPAQPENRTQRHQEGIAQPSEHARRVRSQLLLIKGVTQPKAEHATHQVKEIHGLAKRREAVVSVYFFRKDAAIVKAQICNKGPNLAKSALRYSLISLRVTG